MDTLYFNKGVLFVNRQLTVIVQQKFNYFKTCSLLENTVLLQKKLKKNGCTDLNCIFFSLGFISLILINHETFLFFFIQFIYVCTDFYFALAKYSSYSH